MRVLAALILGATFLCANGSYADSYPTADKAAIAGLKEAIRCSKGKIECGGVIWKADDGYHFTYPEMGTEFGVEITALAASDPRKVADYHVHICSKHNRIFANYFSPADILVDQGFHIVGYMFSFCDRYVRRIDPSPNGDDVGDEEVDFKPHADGTRLIIYLTIGHIVGYIPK